jgi:lipopolysaccharide assembly outer membrane protein LptD (OstA)
MAARSRLRIRDPLVLTVLVVAGIALAWWGMSWWNYLRSRTVSTVAPTQPATAPAPGTPREEVVIQSPTLKHTEGGRLAWQVQLTELKLSAGGQAMAAAGMREALIYDKNGVPTIRLTAQTARGNTSDRNLEVAGDVRAVSQRGVLITTAQIRWIEKERRLYCPQQVVFRSKSAAVTTTGLSYYVDQNLVKAPGIVRMYSGDNKLVGRELVYNVSTEGFEMKNVQAVFNPAAARQMR